MPRETSETTVSSTVRTSTPRADSMSPRDGHVPRRGLGVGRAVLVTLVAVVLVAPTLGQHVIATSDEARFPLLARDMMTRGVWFEAYVREKLFQIGRASCRARGEVASGARPIGHAAT